MQFRSLRELHSFMTTPDMLSNVMNLLPTGTYLMFQILSPLTTNDGTCGGMEKALTSFTLCIFACFCALLAFTDSYVAEDGRLYYGIVTVKGLWNPTLEDSGLADVAGSTYFGGGGKYEIKRQDFVNATLAVAVFMTLTLLSDNVAECFYGSLSPNLKRSVPILVALVIGFIFAFSPPARNGIGFAISTTQISLVSNPVHV
ncbi:hypothetical protein MPTK1_6g08250 [Marchantia polymorpha subsp. ruderalis]|uniref:Uncharacterized protein n=2 Tax=Marchantia polymorpha TaxID=3197 RepID=A0AAF6BPT6_MARPO|nr:hypothetical protein MARPO_0060s0096 [Marchantia polymorpha]BBN14020.1 hypothetical protein Mp_6g08250 [Marchantia polymorpha subsp. ruderalis]|eukprot:PTQ37025.1 hypothetical protein MARPO_0060s0096 [Marchantia polymorpha]